LVLAWKTPGFRFDVLTFESWAGTLRAQPLDHFYSLATRPDHLPGDLWILKATVTVFDSLGGRSLHGEGFDLALQVVPTLGDLLVGLALLLLVRDRRGMGAGRTCANWYLFNPATILLTGLYGQWDSVSLGFLLLGVWLMTQERWWPACSPLLVWAVLIKPQLALAVIVFSMLLLPGALSHRNTALSTPALRGLLAGVWAGFGIATAWAILTPFGVHLFQAPPGQFTLLDRLHHAVNTWPYTTVGAANVWVLVAGSKKLVPDSQPWLLGLTPAAWGLLALGVLALYLGGTSVARWRRSDALVSSMWLAGSVLLGAYLMATRAHERYALPAIALVLTLVALTGFRRDLSRVFWILSTCCTLNMLATLLDNMPQSDTFWVGMSLTYCAAGVYLLLWPWRMRDVARAT
jgi:hypothetical protein